MGASSKRVPLRLMEAIIPCSANGLRQSSQAYRTPRSEWRTRSGRGRRFPTATPEASIAGLAFTRSDMARPTISIVAMSSAAAR